MVAIVIEADPAPRAAPAVDRPPAANADVLAERDGAVDAHPPIARAAIEAALDRVLSSDVFRHSRRHREFLDYIVVAALDGRAHRLKEVTIGLDVFGRRIDGYDPDRDSIVRVEARRLRTKLDRYFRDEGADDAVVLRIPVGSYVPVFEPRGAVDRGAAPLLLVLPFVAPDADPRHAAVAAGLSDLVIERCGDTAGCRVVAPMVAAAYRAQAVDVEALRNRHGVACIVDGSVVGDGPRLRCVLHLSLTRERLRVWSKAFDYDAATGDDLLAFQDRIADAVLAAVVARKEAP